MYLVAKVLAFAALLLPWTATILVQAACPSGWSAVDGRCFRTVFTNPNQCDALCITNGGRWATINSQAQNDWFVARGIAVNNNIWIGLNDNAVEGTYEWTNPGDSFTYSNWMPGQPNNDNTKQCVTMYRFSEPIGSWYWIAGSCTAGKIYCGCVTEDPATSKRPTIQPTALTTPPSFKPTAVPSTTKPTVKPTAPPTAALTACPAGWVSNFGKCYLTTAPKKDYATCLSYCAGFGATLPCVMNTAENAYIASIYSNAGTTDDLCVYLGLNDIVTEGSFQWQAGCSSTMSNFSPGEPNNAHGGEDCTSVYTNGLTVWNDLRCNAVSYCVCEKAAGMVSVPSAAPTFVKPTAAPSTVKPTANPTTLPLTGSPSTVKPTANPTTLPPTVSPSTVKPTANPTTTLPPTVSPSTVEPTANPTTLPPTVSPSTVKPTANPTTLPPTVSPSTVKPTANPTTLPPTVSPTTLPPSAAPSTVQPTAMQSCPAGWVSNFGKCYLPATPRMNYATCLSYCAGLEATLPCVMNAAENNHLAFLIPDLGYSFEDTMFLGLNNLAGGPFEWQPGCASTYTNFVPGEPSNPTEEHCVFVHQHLGPGMWSDLMCGVVANCVCEKASSAAVSSAVPTVAAITAPPTIVPSTIAPSSVEPTAAPTACPAGWVSNFGKCYLTTAPKKDYATCLSYCAGFGATLPCVMNTAENAYIASIYSNAGTTDDLCVYLGLNDIVTEGSFQWQAGCSSTMSNFSPGEPNNAHGGEDCTSVYTNGLTVWNDLRCNAVSYCVCEKAPSSSRRLRGSYPPTV